MEYIRVFLVDLPHTTKGLTVKNNDGGYTILINSRLSEQMQCEAYDHEIAHINNGDFENMYDVSILEHVRHSV